MKTQNHSRTCAACYALKAYEQEKRLARVDFLAIKNPLFMRELMVDLVTDLHHLAGEAGIDWEGVIWSSSNHHQVEGGVQ